MYLVSELYKTVQGEGMNAGRTAVFVRLAGCNLWNGRADDRDRPACAAWCDVVPLEHETPGAAGHTSFAARNGPGGGRYTAAELAQRIVDAWHGSGQPFVVFSGGEPTLQLKDDLFNVLTGMSVAVETNGTTVSPLPAEWHVTVSPKGDYGITRTSGSELKLVVPQFERGAQPAVFEDMAREATIAFDAYYLQPKEPPRTFDEMDMWHAQQWQRNVDLASRYVQDHPFWRLSMQTHKYAQLP